MWGLTLSLLPFKNLPDHSFVPSLFLPYSLRFSLVAWLPQRELDIWHLFDWNWIVDIPSGTWKCIFGIFSMRCASGLRDGTVEREKGGLD